MKNVVAFLKSQSYWQLIAGVFMLFALGMILYTSSYVISVPTEGMIAKMVGYGGLVVIFWAYFIIGLFLCYFADATGKKVMVAIGLCWTCIAITWVAMLDHCGVYDLCFKSAYITLLAICLVLMVCIYWYETNRPPFHTTSKKDFGLAMRIIFFVWASSAVFLAYTLSCTG